MMFEIMIESRYIDTEQRSGDGRNKKMDGRKECRILTECWREKKKTR
jgi:hypothetical protein